MNGMATTRGVFKAYVAFFCLKKWKRNGKIFFPDQLVFKARLRNKEASFRYYFILLSSELLKKAWGWNKYQKINFPPALILLYTSGQIVPKPK